MGCLLRREWRGRQPVIVFYGGKNETCNIK